MCQNADPARRPRRGRKKKISHESMTIFVCASPGTNMYIVGRLSRSGRRWPLYAGSETSPYKTSTSLNGYLKNSPAVSFLGRIVDTPIGGHRQLWDERSCARVCSCHPNCSTRDFNVDKCVGPTTWRGGRYRIDVAFSAAAGPTTPRLGYFVMDQAGISIGNRQDGSYHEGTT